MKRKIRDRSIYLTVGAHSQDGDFLGCSELLGAVFFLCPDLLKASKSEIPSESYQHVELIVVRQANKPLTSECVLAGHRLLVVYDLAC